MDLGKNLREIEKKTMAQLKDFQCATVERINELFRDGQNRVLVADEVGLGKTLIARGAIAKTAIIQYEKNDDIFKMLEIHCRFNDDILFIRIHTACTLAYFTDRNPFGERKAYAGCHNEVAGTRKIIIRQIIHAAHRCSVYSERSADRSLIPGGLYKGGNGEV